MMVAVEVSLGHDFEKEKELKRKWLEEIAAEVASIPGLKTDIYVHALEGNQLHLRLPGTNPSVKISLAEAVVCLKRGTSIEVCLLEIDRRKFELTTWMMEKGEAQIVAKRLKQVFS